MTKRCAFIRRSGRSIPEADTEEGTYFGNVYNQGTSIEPPSAEVLNTETVPCLCPVEGFGWLSAFSDRFVMHESLKLYIMEKQNMTVLVFAYVFYYRRISTLPTVRYIVIYSQMARFE